MLCMLFGNLVIWITSSITTLALSAYAGMYGLITNNVHNSRKLCWLAGGDNRCACSGWRLEFLDANSVAEYM